LPEFPIADVGAMTETNSDRMHATPINFLKKPYFLSFETRICFSPFFLLTYRNPSPEKCVPKSTILKTDRGIRKPACSRTYLIYTRIFGFETRIRRFLKFSYLGEPPKDGLCLPTP
jgi:hypothetical protein